MAMKEERCLDNFRFKSLSRRQVKNETGNKGLELTSKRDKEIDILGNSCIRELNRIEVRESRKSCGVRSLKEGSMPLASSEEQ